MSSKNNNEVSRRKFVKYGAAGIAAAAIAGSGLWWYTQPTAPPTATTTAATATQLTTSKETTGEPIILGMGADIHSANGPNYVNGAQLAIDEINANGGVLMNGKRRFFKQIVEDTKEFQPSFVPSDITTAYTKLIIDDNADFIFGSSGYVTPISMQYKRIYISGSGGNIDHSKIFWNDGKGDYHLTFQDQIDSRGWGVEDTMATLYYAKKYNAKKVAWLVEDQAFCHTHLEVMKDIMGKNGIEVDPILWCPPSKTNFTSELQAIRSAGSPVTFVEWVAISSAPIMQEWRDTKMKTFWVGMDIPGGVPGVNEKVHGLYNYLVDIEGLSRVPISNMTVPFYDAYTARFGGAPDIYAGNYYSAVYMIKGALEKAQADPKDPEGVEEVAKAIHDTEWPSVFGKMKFNENNFISPSDPIEAGFVLLFCQWQGEKNLKVVWPEKFAEVPSLYPTWHVPPGEIGTAL
jgi:branched-chain amino acid transport system substrate-binding protein